MEWKRINVLIWKVELVVIKNPPLIFKGKKNHSSSFIFSKYIFKISISAFMMKLKLKNYTIRDSCERRRD